MNTFAARVKEELIALGFVIEKEDSLCSGLRGTWVVKLGDECVSASKSLGDALLEAHRIFNILKM